MKNIKFEDENDYEEDSDFELNRIGRKAADTLVLQDVQQMHDNPYDIMTKVKELDRYINVKATPWIGDTKILENGDLRMSETESTNAQTTLMNQEKLSSKNLQTEALSQWKNDS